jgi:DNA primase
MSNKQDLFHFAAQYHRALAERIRAYLNGRGIPDEVIERRLLGWNGTRITIPVFNEKGVCASFRLAKDPDDASDAPKMLSMRGSSVDLYGWDTLRLKPHRVVICEGEFDRLVLEANGFDAVTSTGGAAGFKPEWAEAFRDIPEIYVCFDRDPVGYEGMARVCQLMPHARLVELPAEVGDGGDITDYFVRLGKTHLDFEELLGKAQSAPAANGQRTRGAPAPERKTNAARRDEIERLKRTVPIAEVIGRYIELRPSGSTLIGLCPFHEDHKPSLTVYPDRSTFHCYGCGAHGDALSFLREVEGLTFRQALQKLEQFQTDDRNEAA